MILTTVVREGTLNPEGALKAIEMAQGFNLSMFSTPHGIGIIVKSLESVPPDITSFLPNMASSLSGVCFVNWGNSTLWYELVKALMLHGDPNTPSLFGKDYETLIRGEDLKETRETIAARINATPSVAALLLLRWMRTDLAEYEPVLNNIIKSRAPVAAQS